MRKVVILFVITLLFVSCRTTKKNVRSSDETRWNCTTDIQSDKFNSEALIDSMKSLLNADIQVLSKNYSRPDSSGKQHVVSEQLYNIILTNESGEFKSKIGENLQRTHSKSNSSKQNDNQFVENKESEFGVFKPPDVIFLVLVISIIFLVLKKWKTFFCSNKPPHL